MKKIKFKLLIIPASIFGLVIVAACSKNFLNKPPQGTLNPQIMASEAGVQGLLIGAYSLVDGEGAAGDGFASGASNWIWGGVGSDDANKGSDPSDVADAAPVEDWTITPSDGALDQKWIVCYAGAVRCNSVLKILPLATTIPAEEATGILAQTRFLRGFYHFELKKMFGNIVYDDENLTADNTTNTTDVWPNIEADLQFAIDNLPDTWADVGRVNKSAAKAMMAKVLMFEKKYSAAYTLLQDVIANGQTSAGVKYALYPHYYSNFNPAQKNGSESVFAAQTSVQDGSSVDWGGDPNGNYGDILNFPYTGGPGACCGFYNPTQDLADSYKTDATGLPLLDDSWKTGNHVSDPTTPYAGTLDPRIDWAIGRKGIPYLDWGAHPGDAWVRNPGADGHFSPKKDVYASSQKGAYTDVGSAYWGPTELTANNVNIIRFSDVLLWAAECAADAGDLTAAVNYVNQVRTRAADKSGWVSANPNTYDAANAIYTDAATNPADNYKIGTYASFPDKATAVKAIQFERRLELSMEGHRFFDLVRWGIADQVLNDYYNRYRNIMPLKKNAKWTPNKNEIYPIPQNEIDQLNSDGKTRLVQNPGY
jgi:hypothetical protein